MKSQKILITGAAGFIGSSLASRLLSKGNKVVGIDNFTKNYSSKIKRANLKELSHANFRFIDGDILDKKTLSRVFLKNKFDTIVHLAALTGIRASIRHPTLFYRVNSFGTKQLYEIGALHGIGQFIMSSSSSVYGKGGQKKSVESQPRRPRSPYALSKKIAEDDLKLLQKKFKVPTTIFRLFSVYGPKSRPDMAPYLFTEAAFRQKPITIFGQGKSARDFTYIDDVVNAFEIGLTKSFSFEIFNIGNTSPITISELINYTEYFTNQKLVKYYTPSFPEEALVTHANIHKAKKLLGWRPYTNFKEGYKNFVKWFSINHL